MKIKEVTSNTNSYFKVLESLLHAKGIKKEGLILVSGKKIIPEVLKGDFKIMNLVYSDGMAPVAEELTQRFTISHGVKLPNPLFKILDESGTNFPLLVLEAPSIPMFSKPAEGLNVFLALSDPSNLGAALRSLKAFNAAHVVLLKECAHAFHPKVTKTSSGANLSCPLASGPSIEDLDLDSSICLDMGGEALSSFKWPKTSCLVLGEEGRGIPGALKEKSKLLRIEMNTEVESLSAPIALAIACHSYFVRTFLPKRQ